MYATTVRNIVMTHRMASWHSFVRYIIYEAQALAKMATVLGLDDRAQYWTTLAADTTREMDALLWDDATGFYYDRYFNGTLMKIKTVAGLCVNE